MARVIYCKEQKRRPIRLGSLPSMRDIQADIPPGWCEVCGCEVFEAGRYRCPWCSDRKGEN